VSGAAAPRKTGQSIRYPEGSDLRQWYEDRAEQTGMKVNALILLAMAYYRTAVEDGQASPGEEKPPDA
jgi:hypothetical protein